jgi:hypothetical protein
MTLDVIPPPELTGVLTLDSRSIVVGDSATGTVTLSGPAPANGLDIKLDSSNRNAATTPDRVTVAAGGTQATFDIPGIGLGSTTISAQVGSVRLTAPLTVRRKIGKETIGKEIGKELGKEIEKAAPRETIRPATKTVKILTETLAPTRAGSAPAGLDPGASTAPTAQAFILAEERPPVGEAVLNPPGPPEAKLEEKSEAAPAGGGSSSGSARSKGKRVVVRAAPKRKAKSIEKSVVPEKGTIAEDVGKRPV